MIPWYHKLLPLPGNSYHPEHQLSDFKKSTRGCSSCSRWSSSTQRQWWCTYSSFIKSILSSSISIWYATAALPRRSSENLPSLQDLYTFRTLKIRQLRLWLKLFTGH